MMVQVDSRNRVTLGRYVNISETERVSAYIATVHSDGVIMLEPVGVITRRDARDRHVEDVVRPATREAGPLPRTEADAAVR